MLVLTGKVGDIFDIDQGRIIVTVLKLEGDQVRLGFEAPADVVIDRGKVAMAKAAKK